MKQMMADGPRCKRRKQANPRRKNGGLILHIDRDEQDLSLLPERHPNICRRKDSRNSRSFSWCTVVSISYAQSPSVMTCLFKCLPWLS
ncbi:hypothetical protein GDO78_002800 [Eleutherodactylus coqui]|uniref:Uncharacterized protein n=1 Tax=Eleutherodactylus coqui TaxID=57060 RepID=A0A8J6EZC9_ELECQ|nr:hypothetical protein GDO78_002800 [Eleutherodactylus coqui]KAG9477600.1 hypothetical protein GDO78_002800 [Eleutherodactylus coqui]